MDPHFFWLRAATCHMHLLRHGQPAWVSVDIAILLEIYQPNWLESARCQPPSDDPYEARLIECDPRGTRA